MDQIKEFKCDLCGRMFGRKESLSRHINETHLNKGLHKSHFKCKECGKEIGSNVFLKHLKNKHGYDDKKVFIYKFFYTRKDIEFLSDKLKTIYLNKIYDLNKGTNIYSRQLKSFYGMIIKIREFTTFDIDIFLSYVLPFKQKFPKICNSKELCNLVFKNEPENAKKLYELTMKSRNPFTNHGGIYSPFSKKFVGYKGKSDEEIKELVYKAGRYDIVGRTTNQKEYWIKKGFSEEEAIQKVKERNSVFSLEKCIEKYGEKEGYKRWKERQKKWQNTLKSKPIAEIQRINHNKVYKNGPNSGIESEFLNSILPDETHHNVYIKDLHLIVDLIFGKKIIEFYGDYWHCNPRESRFIPEYYHPYLRMTAYEKWEFDKNRIERLKNAGYEVMIIWEMDYNKDKKTTIKECKKFLGV